jgi:hypothetical protein
MHLLDLCPFKLVRSYGGAHQVSLRDVQVRPGGIPRLPQEGQQPLVQRYVPKLYIPTQELCDLFTVKAALKKEAKEILMIIIR